MIGIYERGEERTLEEVTHPDYQSEYAVTVHGLVRDPYNPRTKRLLCDLGRINDSLDRTRHNTDWYVHPDYPNLLLVISLSHTPTDAQFFIPYKGDFFCHERFTLPVLIAAIRC